MQKKNGKGKILLIILVLLLAAGAAGGVYFYKNFYGEANYIKNTRKKDAKPRTEEEKAAKEKMDAVDAYNILLMGVDKHDSSWNGNSDVNVLVTVNNKNGTICLTSFLRDLYAEIPGIGVRKLNAACANGGPELCEQTLEETYGLSIDNYALVDFNAMRDIIDTLGGIELEIDEDERVTANDYITCMCQDNEEDPEPFYIKEAGYVHLGGYQAVGYARNRYTGKGSDFGRTARQRKVLNAIFAKAKEGGIVSLRSAAESVMPYVTHDIDAVTMIGLILQLPKWLDYEWEAQHIPYDDAYFVENEILIPKDMEETRQRIQDFICQ